MARIVHLAVTADTLEPLSRICREVFGFIHTGTIVNPPEQSNGKTIRSGYVAHHLNDGLIDFTLIKFEDQEHADVGSSLTHTGLHHFGIEDRDPESAAVRIREHGGEMLSVAGTLPVKFRAPGGIVAEVIPEGRFTAERIINAAKAAKRREDESGKPIVRSGVAALAIHDGPVPRDSQIPHISQLVLLVDDCAQVADFFQNVFGFEKIAAPGDASSVYITDGKVSLAINKRNAAGGAATAAASKSCIHHFSIKADGASVDHFVTQLRDLGCDLAPGWQTRSTRFQLPGENMIGELVPESA